ncbi:MAG TPA: AEC family transporter [Desulfobulbus sp.]|nr:AEC family transporter [Desulfobulbus sp.]
MPPLATLGVIAPVFLVLFAGKGLHLAGLIDSRFSRDCNRLIYHALLPALLFRKISAADVRHLVNPPLLLVMAATILLMFAITWALSTTPLVPRRAGGSFMTNSFRGNYAYMGLPVSFSAFGDTGLLHASILMAFIVPLVNLLSVLSLRLYSSKSPGRYLLASTLLNPLVLACGAGLAVAVSGLPLPAVIGRSLDIIAGATLPLALFSIGTSLGPGQLRSNILLILLGTACKLLLMPAIALLLLHLAGLPLDTMARVMIILLAAPSATINYVLAAALGGDTESTGGTIVATTLLSMASYMLWLGLP